MYQTLNRFNPHAERDFQQYLSTIISVSPTIEAKKKQLVKRQLEIIGELITDPLNEDLKQEYYDIKQIQHEFVSQTNENYYNNIKAQPISQEFKKDNYINKDLFNDDLSEKRASSASSIEKNKIISKKRSAKVSKTTAFKNSYFHFLSDSFFAQHKERRKAKDNEGDIMEFENKHLNSECTPEMTSPNTTATPSNNLDSVLKQVTYTPQTIHMPQNQVCNASNFPTQGYQPGYLTQPPAKPFYTSSAGVDTKSTSLYNNSLRQESPERFSAPRCYPQALFSNIEISDDFEQETFANYLLNT